MASNSSGSLAPGASYTLGEYTFTLSNVVTEDERVLQAHCSGPEGNAAGGITVSSSTQLLSWSVEADETEATVYATVKEETEGEGGGTSDLDTGNVEQPIPSGNYFRIEFGKRLNHVPSDSYECNLTSGKLLFFVNPVGPDYSYDRRYIIASKTQGVVGTYTNVNLITGGTSTGTVSATNVYEHNGKIVYYAAGLFDGEGSSISSLSGTYLTPWIVPDKPAEVAWTMIYGNAGWEETDKFVTRFPIDIQEAGDGWADTGDPMTTLHVTVTGALSGRHNDPTASAEGSEFFSYVPADNAKEAWYGCGGDGGYGGGGGAGASTILINEFPTSRAGNKELVANARRHGYGSGGGKGGNGGDGCILIYYSTPVPPNP